MNISYHVENSVEKRKHGSLNSIEISGKEFTSKSLVPIFLTQKFEHEVQLLDERDS